MEAAGRKARPHFYMPVSTERENLLSQQLINRFKFYCLDYLDRPHIKPERFMKKPASPLYWRRPIILLNEKEEQDFKRLNTAIVDELTSILNLEAGKLNIETPYHYIPGGFCSWHSVSGDSTIVELSFTENPGESKLSLSLVCGIEDFIDRYVSLNIYSCHFPAKIEAINSSRITLSYSY